MLRFAHFWTVVNCFLGISKSQIRVARLLHEQLSKCCIEQAFQIYCVEVAYWDWTNNRSAEHECSWRLDE